MASLRVQMHVEWAVPSGQAPRVTAALQSIMAATRRQSGCLACFLSTEAGDCVKLSYQETWQDEEHLKRQVGSERFTSLAGLVEQGTDPPRFEFSLPSGTRGLDYAEDVRVAPVRHRRTAAR